MYETCWTVVADENPHQQNTADLLCGTKYIVEERGEVPIKVRILLFLELKILLAIGKS